MLTNAHPVINHRADLFTMLAVAEGFGTPGRPGLPYFDSAGKATIGYGFNMEDRNVARLVLAQMGILAGKTDSQVLQIESDLRTAINAGRGGPLALEASLDAFAQTHGVAGGKFQLTDDPPGFGQGKQIFDQILVGVPNGSITGIPGSQIGVEGKEARLNNNLNLQNAADMDTKEYVALMSLFYNAESLVKAGSKLATAVINDQRAEAWYQIRYQSDADGQHTGRRITESNLFGLYDHPELGVQEAEAKEVLRMYTAHRDQIRTYESQHAQDYPIGGTASIDFQLIGARTPLIQTYAQGHTINGDVLVGQDAVIPGDQGLAGTAQNDLIFGENGHDILKGEAGDDVVYGGAGTDQLTGGTGSDYLDGGAGYDTYVYRINDGQDTIRDSDGKGSLYYDGQLVAGGVRRAGDPENTYRSLDGTMTFVQSGTDLLVNNLITIQNYTLGSGVLGITLSDRSSAPQDTGVPTGPFVFTVTLGPGDVNGSLPEGLSGPGAVYGNELSNILDGSISLNDEFGDLLDGGAGHDSLIGRNGQDYLIGGAGDDYAYVGDGDVFLGGDDADIMAGSTSISNYTQYTIGTGNHYADGGAGNDTYVVNVAGGRKRVGLLSYAA